MNGRDRAWTPAEDELARLANPGTLRQLGAQLGRSYSAVRLRRAELRRRSSGLVERDELAMLEDVLMPLVDAIELLRPAEDPYQVGLCLDLQRARGVLHQLIEQRGYGSVLHSTVVVQSASPKQPRADERNPSTRSTSPLEKAG